MNSGRIDVLGFLFLVAAPVCAFGIAWSVKDSLTWAQQLQDCWQWLVAALLFLWLFIWRSGVKELDDETT